MTRHELLRATIAELGRDTSYRRPCAARLAYFLRNPGDLFVAGGLPLLVGMAIAAHEVRPAPGWIPEVQRRAVEYGEVAERIVKAEVTP